MGRRHLAAIVSHETGLKGGCPGVTGLGEQDVLRSLWSFGEGDAPRRAG